MDAIVADTAQSVDMLKRAQAQALTLLRNACTQDCLSHTLLFVGPQESGLKDCALLIAQWLLRDQRKICSGDFDEWLDSLSQVSCTCPLPDLHLLRPKGALSYVIDQIRELIADMSLAPICASRKVYILEDADHLSIACANALLKSLEEPPENCTLILLARSTYAVLPTIVSRCSVVHFHLPPKELRAQRLAYETHVDSDRASYALELFEESYEQAKLMCRYDILADAISFEHKILCDLKNLCAFDIIQAAEHITVLLEPAIAACRDRFEHVRSSQKTILSQTAYRSLEAQHKRELSQLTRLFYEALCEAAASFLRITLLIRTQAPQLNHHAYSDAHYIEGLMCDDECILKALQCCFTMQEALRCNVSPRLCLETMLLEIREVLYA